MGSGFGLSVKASRAQLVRVKSGLGSGLVLEIGVV